MKPRYNLFLVLALLFAYSGAFSQVNNKKLATVPYTIEAGSLSDADAALQDFLLDRFAILSDKWIGDITATQKVEQINDSTKTDVLYKVTYQIPKSFLADTAKILWELNIPQFESHIYQLYAQDTIYIDTWPNVVGRVTDKTYTGNYKAFRIRNWPSWKDPDPAKKDVEATPPGPGNPLGLFVVHYDERSLRYFHGTNKPGVLKKTLRYESHGCVRNDNDNIKKMKEFILKRVVKSKDLTSWVKSKKSMTYDFDEIDKFPVRIIYKTYELSQDDYGHYISFFKDIYNYQGKDLSRDNWNDPSLMTFTTKENILNEYNREYGWNIPKEKLDEIIEYLMKNGKPYERYYFEDLKSQFLTNQ
ncbi:MAG: L,D-transpeptidase [Bacteroidetes bacterium]|nr:L,D-transpeptidase [Bacteroidota bacterium]